MKTIALLLLTLATGFSCAAQTSRPGKAKPKVNTVFNPELLSQMMRELTAQHLRAVYGKSLVIEKVTQNIHYPADRDTVLMANTGFDRVYVFTNKYNSYLISATITSRLLTFGHGVRVGEAKSTFCKAFKLPSTFGSYQISDECSNIFFTFHQGILAEVSYQAMDCD